MHQSKSVLMHDAHEFRAKVRRFDTWAGLMIFTPGKEYENVELVMGARDPRADRIAAAINAIMSEPAVVEPATQIAAE